MIYELNLNKPSYPDHFKDGAEITDYFKSSFEAIKEFRKICLSLSYIPKEAIVHFIPGNIIAIILDNERIERKVLRITDDILVAFDYTEEEYRIGRINSHKKEIEYRKRGIECSKKIIALYEMIIELEEDTKGNKKKNNILIAAFNKQIDKNKKHV